MNVAIVVGTHDLAAKEWQPNLIDPYVWQPRTILCTCYDRRLLQQAGKLGVTVPACHPECPYEVQRHACKGKITIYQYNHLYLNKGERLAHADLIIIDENPLGVLLQEHSATHYELRDLIDHIQQGARPDAALPLLVALLRVGNGHTSDSNSLRGADLLMAIERELDTNLATALHAAKTSRYASVAPIVPTSRALPRVPYFLGKLIAALEQALACQQYGNSSLDFGRYSHKQGAWTWYERHPMLQKSFGKPHPPAVIVLDGSAKEQICERLYAPWPVHFVPIETNLSPYVRVIQCLPTPSTRHILRDRSSLERLGRAIANVCVELGVVIDGGVSYEAALPYLHEKFGGTWLHYGGQRGHNELKDTHTFAIVASPTISPNVVLSKAMALWADDAPIDCTWEHVGAGEYVAPDPRLDAVNQLHGLEELRQAAHRCRPILSQEPTTLLIFSPWNFGNFGFSPHYTIVQVPHGNSAAAQEAMSSYQQLRQGQNIQSKLETVVKDYDQQQDMAQMPLTSGLAVDDPQQPLPSSSFDPYSSPSTSASAPTAANDPSSATSWLEFLAHQATADEQKEAQQRSGLLLSFVDHGWLNRTEAAKGGT